MQMVEISASMVKDLREKSGAAMMDCKKALVESQGDFEKAFELLRQKGIAAATKKATRSASEGLVVGKVSDDGKRAALIEVNCETDFVARNEQFQAFTQKLVDIVLNNKVSDVESLLKQKNGSGTVADLLTENIATIGENLVIRRASYLENTGNGCIGLYVHALGGKMGALVSLSSNKEVNPADVSALARDIAMHVVSAKPQFIDRSQIPAEIVENERRIESGKEDLAKKPAEIREKIVTGRVDKIFAERCLVEQPFVKDPSQNVGQVLTLKDKGLELKPVAYTLFILGEADGETVAN